MSMIKEIAQLGNPVLREIANTVNTIPVELIASLQATLANTQGVGIAAPQISESERVIIIASRPNKRYPHAPLMQPTVMINPRFKALSDNTQKDWEGCLSIPSIRALVPRYTEIEVYYSDELGNTQNSVLTDFVARIFQHEIDHLDGIVYLDRVEFNSDIIAESEYFKRYS
jgi:peptide deformylase